MSTTLDDILAMPYSYIAMADQEDGGWVIFYPDLPGCITQADTYDEAAHMARDAFETWVTYRFDHNMPIPEPSFDADPGWDWEAVRPPEAIPSMTTADAAMALDVSARRVHQLARARGLGERHGKTLMFSALDIDSMRNRNGPGRPSRQSRGAIAD